ncbi:MAG TPA: hypothetical protein VK661_09810, partial [Planctomycetota bacterium]|nr:hypothetical protein [Planctomycetota bacterium]
MTSRAAALLLLLLPVPASAQEFKKPVLIPKERYVFGLPIEAKRGSKFAKLNLVPQGWELWLVAANDWRVQQVGDTDMKKPATISKARDSTQIHKALSTATDANRLVLTIVVRRPGNSRGILVEVTFTGWDARLNYSVRKWSQDENSFIFPTASSQVGSEPFTARVQYTEKERLEEVAEYDLRKREEAEARKNPGAPLKDRESYRIVQRKLRLDAGLEKAGPADEAYQLERQLRAGELLTRAENGLTQKAWFDCHRAARAGTALDPFSKRLPAILSQLRTAVEKLDPEERGKIRAKVLAEVTVELKEKDLVAAAEGAAFCAWLSDADKEAARFITQARKAAFGAEEMSKDDFDGWSGILGGFPDLPPATDFKEGEIYRAWGKVARAGNFTLV